MGLCSADKPVEEPIPQINKDNVVEVLQKTYSAKIVPVEKRHAYYAFHTPPLMPTEFRSKPMVLFLGQYSVGKTSMIRYLLGNTEYPGSRIGPEPTTDAYTVVHYSESPRTVMGTTLAADGSMPFQSLNQFGSCFLTHFMGAGINAPLAQYMYLIDTPGILSGRDQTVSREYDFAQVARFMADKVDMIILMFDTSKLDISDEYKQVLLNLKGNEEKIKIVLNKADAVDPGELIRVRGALMWSLSKIIDTPEVPKVYIGSFNGKGIKNSEILELFKDDYIDLFRELERLPSQVLSRRVNDVIKRAKAVRIHAMIMDEVMKPMWSKSDAAYSKALTDERLKAIFADLIQRNRLSKGDMPNYQLWKELALKSYFKAWNRVDVNQMVKLEQFLMQDISKVLEFLPHAEPDTEFKKIFDDLLDQVNLGGKKSEADDDKTKSEKKKKKDDDDDKSKSDDDKKKKKKKKDDDDDKDKSSGKKKDSDQDKSSGKKKDKSEVKSDAKSEPKKDE